MAFVVSNSRYALAPLLHPAPPCAKFAPPPVGRRRGGTTWTRSPWKKPGTSRLEVEPKWQKRWERPHLFRAGERPGPRAPTCWRCSRTRRARMHMGHVRVYTLGDVMARVLRMRGNDVLHPMGWDAFGLPGRERGDQATGIHPAERTRRTSDSFRGRFEEPRDSYDWSREIATREPEYYRWNQWLFLRMLERGIVYRRTSRVNWCPSAQRCWPTSRSWRAVLAVRHARWSSAFSRVVPANHRVRRRAARPTSTQLTAVARAGAHHAAQLDRPVRRRAGATSPVEGRLRADHRVHHASGHDLRLHVPGHRAGAASWCGSSRSLRS